MHESTRRLLCRVAFLLGCVVPTMCTLSWITYRQSSWSVAAVEAELSDTIGLKCRIAKYYNPKPSKWVFEQVRLERAGSDAVFFPVLKAELVDETWLFSADEAHVLPVLVPRLLLCPQVRKRVNDDTKDDVEQDDNEQQEEEEEGGGGS